jgi:hypothetical protein
MMMKPVERPRHSKLLSTYRKTLSQHMICAPGRTRTYDRQIRRLLLYPLSYGGLGSSHVAAPARPGILSRARGRRGWPHSALDRGESRDGKRGLGLASHLKMARGRQSADFGGPQPSQDGWRGAEWQWIVRRPPHLGWLWSSP